jgi:hypothetical protein
MVEFAVHKIVVRPEAHKEKQNFCKFVGRHYDWCGLTLQLACQLIHDKLSLNDLHVFLSQLRLRSVYCDNFEINNFDGGTSL